MSITNSIEPVSNAFPAFVVEFGILMTERIHD